MNNRVVIPARFTLELIAVRDTSDSLATEQFAGEKRQSKLVLAPKDYFLGPVFAASKQTGPREITIGDRRYLIGGFHPMKRNVTPPALDVRHARALFALLSFRDPFENTRLIRFSFNEFCQKYARTNGGRYARAIAEIVGDLMDSYKGAEVRAKLSPEKVGYPIFLEEHGDKPDRQITDDETFSLEKHPLCFYSTPPATFGLL